MLASNPFFRRVAIAGLALAMVAVTGTLAQDVAVEPAQAPAQPEDAVTAPTAEDAQPLVDGEILAVGDTLDLTVISLPKLDRKLFIDASGTIVIPLMGRIQAAGRSLTEVEAAIKEGMPQLVYRERDGSTETLIVVRSEEISLVLAGYRPVVVDGLVTDPGSVAYMPGMSVRQAIALAGGLDDEFVENMVDPVSDLADFRSERDALLPKYAGSLAEIARIEAQLEGRSEVDGAALQALPLSTQAVDAVLDVSRRRLAEALAANEAEKAANEQTKDLVETQIFASLKLDESAALRLTTEEAELARVRDFVNRNVYSAERLVEANRLYYQAQAQSATASREVAELQERLLSLNLDIAEHDRETRSALLEELSQVLVTSQGQAADLASLGQRVSALETAISLTTETAPGRLLLEIRRHSGEAVSVIEAALDDSLRPGDTVTVSMIAGP